MKLNVVPNLMVAGTATVLLVASAMAQDAPVDSTPPTLPFETGQSTTAVTTITTTTTATHDALISVAPTHAAAPSDATAYSDLPLQPVTVGNVTYLTGGIGDEERNQLQEAKKDYNLHIMSSSKDGAFTGATQITVTDNNGSNVLTVAEAGPLFLAKLPAGTYIVDGAAHGESKKQKITVGSKGAANIHFNW